MKRYLTIIALIVVLAVIALLSIRIFQGVEARRAIAERIATLPEFELATLENQRFENGDLSPNQPVILIYFSTICPYCQSELDSIRSHAELKRQALFLLISQEPLDVLQQYQEAHELDTEPHIRILRDSLRVMAPRFGISMAPSTFIYGSNHRLLKRFVGEASAEAMYRVLSEAASDRNSTVDR